MDENDQDDENDGGPNMFEKRSEESEGDQNLPMFQRESEEEEGDQNINIDTQKEVKLEPQVPLNEDESDGDGEYDVLVNEATKQQALKPGTKTAKAKTKIST